MRSLARTFAPLLLAALVASGAVAPSVHRALHGEAEARERAAHLAAGHHHHGVGDGHGAEWTEACDAGLLPHDFACVLCHGLSAHSRAAAPSFFPLPLQRGVPATAEGASAAALRDRLLNRGPPGVA